MGKENLLITEVRPLFAEFLGTFFLTFVVAGGMVITALSHHEETYIAKVASPGLLVMAMIYTLGNVSGAHINPAVTLAFAIRRAFPWMRVPGYWIVQILGAALAVYLLSLLFHDIGNAGLPEPHYDILQSFIMEVILTLLLVTVIIGTATGHKIVGPNAGIAVGATIALCGMFASPVSGAIMNPALAIGPALVTAKFSSLWIYIFAPFLGAFLAVICNFLVHGKPQKHEEEAASGEGLKPSDGSTI